MKSLRGSLAAVLVFGIAAWSRAQISAVSGSSKPPVPHLPDSPDAVTLYTQDDNSASEGVSSQDFQTAVDQFDDEVADDFVVPAGTLWRVTGVHANGVYYNGTGPAPTVHVHFYDDAAGLPGAPVCDYLDIIPTDSSGTFDVALPSPCVLGPGPHWVSVIAHMDQSVGGQWGWNERTIQANSAAAWRNPGAGFGTPCTAFGARQATCAVGGAPDQMFSLSGTPGGVVPAGPPECGERTEYFENTTPLPTADVSVVSSTINVSGMDPYIWDVNAITFLRHTFAADVDMTIMSPAGTVVTLTTDNGAGNDDVFNGTVWDDQADPGSQVPYAGNPNIVTDHAYTNLVSASPLTPEEALGAFIGEDPNGTWTITISDDLAGDNGTLDKWGLQITTLPTALRTPVTAIASNTNPVPIPTGPAVITSTIDMSFDPATFICGGSSIQTSIQHTFAADIDMTLTSPHGTVVTLTTDNGAGNDNVFNGTSWFDRANLGGQVPYTTNDGLVTDQAYVNLTVASPLVPEEPLSAFIGEDPRGIWTLTISDDLAGDGGSLDSWTLNIVTCTCAVAVPDNPVRVDAHGLVRQLERQRGPRNGRDRDVRARVAQLRHAFVLLALSGRVQLHRPRGSDVHDH
jgi:subtilisin-like proprotein convertase family protein